MKTIAFDYSSVKDWLPSITKLRAGAREVAGAELSHARLAHFDGMAILEAKTYFIGKNDN